MELRNFRRGRHVYSAWQPSRWASAHILVNFDLPSVTDVNVNTAGTHIANCSNLCLHFYYYDDIIAKKNWSGDQYHALLGRLFLSFSTAPCHAKFLHDILKCCEDMKVCCIQDDGCAGSHVGMLSDIVFLHATLFRMTFCTPLPNFVQISYTAAEKS